MLPKSCCMLLQEDAVLEPSLGPVGVPFWSAQRFVQLCSRLLCSRLCRFADPHIWLTGRMLTAGFCNWSEPHSTRPWGGAKSIVAASIRGNSVSKQMPVWATRPRDLRFDIPLPRSMQRTLRVSHLENSLSVPSVFSAVRLGPFRSVRAR